MYLVFMYVFGVVAVQTNGRPKHMLTLINVHIHTRPRLSPRLWPVLLQLLTMITVESQTCPPPITMPMGQARRRGCWLDWIVSWSLLLMFLRLLVYVHDVAAAKLRQCNVTTAWSVTCSFIKLIEPLLWGELIVTSPLPPLQQCSTCITY